MRLISRTALFALGSLLSVAALAQAPAAAPSKPLSTSLGLVVFPAKGQTADKQAADEGECFAWSKGQTGVDPFNPAASAPPPPPAQTSGGGERAKGAVRGAAAGAIIGEVASNDAGKGAAIGATAGVVAGGRESRQKQAAAQQQQAQQQQAAVSQQKQLFNKGFAACLESRGYTVK